MVTLRIPPVIFVFGCDVARDTINPILADQLVCILDNIRGRLLQSALL